MTTAAAVTPAANTPTAQALKAVDYAFTRRRSDEPIMATDPQAREKLIERITDLEHSRKAMKDIKGAIRLKAVVTGNERLREMGLSDALIAKCRSEGRSLFPTWQLQNLGANITRLRKRLEDVEAEAARAPAEEVEGVGYRLVENTDLGRIQILFLVKPDAETRTVLKRNGFRWAPSQDAWQRHLNENGRYAAKRALDTIARAAVRSLTVSPSPHRPAEPPHRKVEGGFAPF